MSGGRLRLLRIALACWAAVSLAVALLPAGDGGTVRALNALAFLTLGPACALGVVLTGVVPPAVSWVVALTASLTVLLLSSQLLLLIGLWSVGGVTALVALTVGALVVDWPKVWAELSP